ncbi:MAG: hypothetical protein KGJ53_13795 [Alphaproteobacteria bacterium]|nr:hypothetical protein [Alphaproteobacteria bacterium]
MSSQSKILRLSMLAAGVAMAAAMTAGASAGGVATRCNWRGCMRIVCHDSGNRCYRVDGDEYRDGYREGYDGRRVYDQRGYERPGGWRYDCDRDADRCSVRREHASYYDRYNWNG